MSALARYFRHSGAEVSGYDKTPTPLTDQLAKEGMKIHFEENTDLIPENPGLVIYTPAIPKDNKEFRYVLNKKVPLMKRSEVLGKIAEDYFTIAVSGTHGKTTTSTLIAHILKVAGIPHIAFLGGISRNYRTNFMYGGQGRHICVVEADEFDRSFLKIKPDIAIITSADPDHLDIYNTHEQLLESFEAFTGNIRTGGSLIMKRGVNIRPEKKNNYGVFSYYPDNPFAGRGTTQLKGGPDTASVKTKKMVTGTFTVSNANIQRGLYHFNFNSESVQWENLILGLPGYFNLENALAATAAAFLLKIPETQVARALRSYKGVVRRFDFKIRKQSLVFIDDYAHHPEELRACINAVREMYPGKKLTGIFQPHLYSRTRDLADDFASSLDLLDEVILLDIYPAREIPIPGVSSKMILDKLTITQKHLLGKSEVAGFLRKRKPQVLLTLGAGDIDQMVEPIKKVLEE
jgi:UDP-N-acetylmuramate--alanine ligase